MRTTMHEQSLVLIKPDALQRGLVGEIITRFERKGLKLLGIKMALLSDEILDDWYAHLKDKDFFPNVKTFMKWTPVVAMVWEGLDAIKTVRNIVGTTKAREAEAGSIRGDYGMSGQQNLIHASDSIESANKEINLIFSNKDIFEYQSISEQLIYSKEEHGLPLDKPQIKRR